MLRLLLATAFPLPVAKNRLLIARASDIAVDSNLTLREIAVNAER